MRGVLFIAILISALLTTACGKKPERPENLIPRGEMIMVLTDVSLVEAKFQRRLITPGQKVDELALKNYTALFKKHHITADQFRSSYLYYQKDPENLRDMLEEVIVELSKREADEKRALKTENKEQPKVDSTTISDKEKLPGKNLSK